MEPVTHTIKADDGVSLAVYRWSPEGTPRGLVQVVHGMAEHVQRYAPVAKVLVEAGWEVWGHDQRGHGHTAASKADHGFFAEHDGWRKVLSDVRVVRAAAREAVPTGPLCLLGHSMGSFVSLSSTIQDANGVDALALSGSNRPGGLLVMLGLQVARFERLRQGPRGRSALLDFLSFGSFNNAFKPARTPFDWLSRDPAQVDRYIEDPLCGFRCTNQLWVDLLGALLEMDRVESLRRLGASLPVLIFSGDKDPVGGATAGLKALIGRMEQAGLARVEHRFYPDGRHEMFNETNRGEVIGDLAAWLEKVTP